MKKEVCISVIIHLTFIVSRACNTIISESLPGTSPLVSKWMVLLHIRMLVVNDDKKWV